MAQVNIEYVSSVTDALRKQDQLTASMDDFAKKVERDATGALGVFGVSVTKLGQPLTLLAEGLKSSVDETINLATQVGNLARETGTSAEEASVMIQVTDDVGISFETLRLASKKLSEEGIQPTFENIKELAAQYLALPPGVERAQFAQDKFGRSGLEMQKILVKSTAELDAMAESLEGSALIMDEQAVQAAENYRMALDSASDAMLELKVKAGVPLLGFLAEAINLTLENIDVNAELARMYEAGEIGLLAYSDAVSAQQRNLGVSNDTVKTARDNLSGYTASLSSTTVQVERAAGEHSETLAPAVASVPWLSGRGDMVEYYRAIDKVVAAAEPAVSVTDRLSGSIDYLSGIMAGAVGNEMEDFETKQSELRQEFIDYKTVIDDLNTKKYLTAAQKQDFLDARAGLEDVTLALDENATAHEEATERILFGIVQQQVAIDGFTTEELKFLNDLAGEWGLIDQETRTATDAIIESVGRAAESGNWEQVLDDLGHVREAVLDIPTSVNINITTSGGAGVEGVIPLQHGGPAFAGHPYFVGETGPELFVPGQSGTVISNQTLNMGGVSLNFPGAPSNPDAVAAAIERRLGRLADARLRTR